LWEVPPEFSEDIGPDYCRKACGGERCEKCPAPRLLQQSVPAVLGYTVVRTQWRWTGGMQSSRIGLDYPAVVAAWQLHRASPLGEEWQLPPDAELFPDVQVIEHALLRADSERNERERAEREAMKGGRVSGDRRHRYAGSQVHDRQ
jgi:hypothetical protein